VDLLVGVVEATVQLVFLEHELLVALDWVAHVVKDVDIQVEVVLAPLVLCLPGGLSQTIVDCLQAFAVWQLPLLGVQAL
jgi:hypothetical protein